MLSLIAATALSPTLLVLNKGTDTVWLIDLKTSEKKELKTGPNPNEVIVSPDQKTAAISEMGGNGRPAGKTITLIDLPTKTITRTIDITPHGAPHGIHWLSNDRLVFTSHVSDSINELDLKTGKIVRTLPTEQKGTHLVVFSPKNDRAYAVNAHSGSVTAFDFTSGKILKQITCGKGAEGISISADGKWVACGNVHAGDVSIIDTTKLEVVHTIPGVSLPIRTIFTKDGKHLAISSVGTGALEIYDAKSWKKVTSVDLKQKPMAKPEYQGQYPAPMNLWQTKNGRIYVVLVTSHAVAEIDAQTWKVVKTYDTGDLPDGLSVSEA